MRRHGRGALPPAGSPFGLGDLRAVLHNPRPERELIEGLQSLLGVERVALYASGREALRSLLVFLAKRSDRSEVVIPAYTCFSLPSAGVAAGLRVRLVDVGPRGEIDPAALAHLPLEKSVAVIVCNLFGVPERLSPLCEVAQARGACVVDDAAQALGAKTEEGAVGSRGSFGLLSFGRGKPLGALRGGALVWREATTGPDVPPLPAPARSIALARALGFDLSLWPPLFRLLAAIPQLGIGESRFDPSFAQGRIDGASLALAAALVPGLVERGSERGAAAQALARRLSAESRFEPLLAKPTSAGVYPRLALRAPTAAARDAALAGLERLGAGASPMYPCGLGAIPALRHHLADPQPCPGASEFAATVLTLPTHGHLHGARLERAVEVLAAASRR